MAAAHFRVFKFVEYVTNNQRGFPPRSAPPSVRVCRFDICRARRKRVEISKRNEPPCGEGFDSIDGGGKTRARMGGYCAKASLPRRGENLGARKGNALFCGPPGKEGLMQPTNNRRNQFTK
jgi:hypothetical protein